MIDQLRNLPLSDVEAPRDLMAKNCTLYIIETFKNGKWEILKRGRINKAINTSKHVEQVYGKYGDDNNYRIVMYGSCLTYFPDEIIKKQIAVLTHKIERLKEGIQIAKTDGFCFKTSEELLFSDADELDFDVVSENTGLGLRLIDYHQSGDEEIYLCLGAKSVFSKIKEEDLDSHLVIEIIHSHLQTLLCQWETDLLDLMHRETKKNKRSYAEILSSIWHGSTAQNKRMVYLLEFLSGKPRFKKYELKSISTYEPLEVDKALVHAPIYLQHGENKYIGLPVSNFGWSNHSQEAEIDERYAESIIGFNYSDFVNELGDLVINADYLGHFQKGEESHRKLIHYCKKHYLNEHNPKGCSSFIREFIEVLYGGKNYLPGVKSRNGCSVPSYWEEGLDHLEGHQRINNIWDVI